MTLTLPIYSLIPLNRYSDSVLCGNFRKWRFEDEVIKPAKIKGVSIQATVGEVRKGYYKVKKPTPLEQTNPLVDPEWDKPVGSL